jgi:hypothetical protein
MVGQGAFDKEERVGADGHGAELACGGHAMDDVANAGACGEWREENFGLFSSGGDGGAQIDGEECGERGGLPGVGGGGELRGVAIFEEAPAGRLAGGVGRGGAEGGPQLDEGAEDGGFGELAAEEFANFNGSLRALFVESLPGAEDDGGDAAAGGRGLPLAIAADGNDPGKNVGGNEEVGLLREGAEEVERDDVAGIDEADGEIHRGGNGVGGRQGADGAHARFNKRGRGRGELGVTGKEEAEVNVVEPVSGVVVGEDRRGVLTPQRGARDL